MDISAKNPIVIDNGTSQLRIGFANDESKTPNCKIKSLLGLPKYLHTNKKSQFLIGKQLKDTKKGVLKLLSPFKNCQVQNWNHMEQLWQYSLTQLKVKGNENSILITEMQAPLGKYRKQMFEIMFEKLNVKQLFVAPTGILNLFGAGKTTGLVLDSGQGLTRITPIVQGYQVGSCFKTSIAGRAVTEHLAKLFKKNGISFMTSSQLEIVKEIKQKYCHLSSTSAQKTELQQYLYELPDGQIIHVGAYQLVAPDILFSPRKIGYQSLSVVQLVSQCLQNVDIQLRHELINQTVLAGGTTKSEGFIQRFLVDSQKAIPGAPIRIFAPQNRDDLCWLGGKIMAKLSSFQNNWLTKAEYKEKGEQCFFKKFI